MDLLAASNSFVSLFITLETFSIALYALCAFETRSSASLEAGLKYLVLGSIGSAILALRRRVPVRRDGLVPVPGGREGPRLEDPDSLLALAGTALVLAGLGFKIAVVPFHMWTPDVYEGSPTPVTAFMSAATKAAAFAALFRVLVTALPAMGDVWRPAVATASIVTMLFAQHRGAAADEPEADPGLLVGRPRRLPADGDRVGRGRARRRCSSTSPSTPSPASARSP